MFNYCHGHASMRRSTASRYLVYYCNFNVYFHACCKTVAFDAIDGVADKRSRRVTVDGARGAMLLIAGWKEETYVGKLVYDIVEIDVWSRSVLAVLYSSYMNECLLRDKAWVMADNLCCKA
jgi:hypothetical protein